MNLLLSLSIIVICAVLNRLGGSKSKNFRRWGIGIALSIYGIIVGNWWGLLCIGTSHLFRLPVTLKGYSIPEHWFNWAWLYVLGFLYGLVPFPLSIPVWTSGLIYAGIFGLIFGFIATLSNIRSTANIFKWQYVEIIYGTLIGLIAVI